MRWLGNCGILGMAATAVPDDSSERRQHLAESVVFVTLEVHVSAWDLAIAFLGGSLVSCSWAKTCKQALQLYKNVL